jgi:hypothetical protein
LDHSARRFFWAFLLDTHFPPAHPCSHLRRPGRLDLAARVNGKRHGCETIDFEDSFDRECFVIRPERVKFFNRKGTKTVYPDQHPLTLVAGHQSRLWTEQIKGGSGFPSPTLRWLKTQVSTIVSEHEAASLNIDERDLLRSAGALDLMGLRLGVYRGKGLARPDARVQFDGYPEYPCPVEVEEQSGGFLAKHHRAHRRMRLALLCVEHDRREVLQGYVDVIELRELARLLGTVA